METRKERIKWSIKKNLYLMQTPFMSILPGQISFFIILSIIPLISVIAMLISSMHLDINMLTNFINNYMPRGVSNLLISIFNEQKAGAIDILFILTAFYLASKATHSIIVASTTIYNGKQKDFISTRIKAIIMLIILVVLVLIMVGLMFIGNQIMKYLVTINADFNPAIYFKYPFKLLPNFFSCSNIVLILYLLIICSISLNFVLSRFVYYFSSFLNHFFNWCRFTYTTNHLNYFFNWFFSSNRFSRF